LSTEPDGSASDSLDPSAAPGWMKPLLDHVSDVPHAYRRRVPADVLAAITAANTTATLAGARRDAAVLVLFSGPQD
jgi:hypothetical protein